LDFKVLSAYAYSVFFFGFDVTICIALPQKNRWNRMLHNLPNEVKNLWISRSYFSDSHHKKSVDFTFT